MIFLSAPRSPPKCLVNEPLSLGQVPGADLEFGLGVDSLTGALVAETVQDAAAHDASSHDAPSGCRVRSIRKSPDPYTQVHHGQTRDVSPER